VAATLEKAITYVFAESPIRNAEARSSTLLCSTIYFQPFTAASIGGCFGQVANTWLRVLVEGLWDPKIAARLIAHYNFLALPRWSYLLYMCLNAQTDAFPLS
jgi:hypothetical protein